MKACSDRAFMRAFTTTMAKFFASLSANDHHKHVRKPAAIVARVVFTLIALALPLCSALSKRIAPPTVTPVIHEGVRYVAPTDDGRRAYVEVWDVQTNKRLWELTVFTNRIDPKLEEDVQWVFINAMRLRHDTLIVTSERGQKYEVDLKTKAIRQSDPAQPQTADATAQGHDIPESVEKVIRNGLLAKSY